MGNTLKWKGEVTFEGTMEEFASFVQALDKQPVTITVGELGSMQKADGKLVLHKFPIAGYMRFELSAALTRAKLEKLTEGAPRMQFMRIKDIAGGIRTPHLHLDDQLVLVDRERFKTILGDMARDVFQQRAMAGEDFYDMVKPLSDMDRG